MAIADEYEARWDDDAKVYAVSDEAGAWTWVSPDGDRWYADPLLVRPASGATFKRATIRLAGGPRDGEVVA